MNFWELIHLMVVPIVLCDKDTSSADEDYVSDDAHHSPPEFLPSPSNLTYYEGDVAILYCVIQNLGTKTISWRRASEPTPLIIGEEVFVEDTRFMVNHVKLTNHWNLVINNVQFRDAGLYECQVSAKTQIRKLVKLNVSERPTPKPPVIVISGSKFVEKGTSILLSCNATGGDYPPDDIDWFKDGNKLTSDSRKGLYTTKFVSISEKLIASNLEIKNADIDDAGTYVCRTSNLHITSMKVNVLKSDKMNNQKRGIPGAQANSPVLDKRHGNSSHRTQPCYLLMLLFTLRYL